MISDEPDEDADGFDDDASLESFIGVAGPRPVDDSPLPLLPQWPAHSHHDIGLQVDTPTIAWFKSAHPDWQRQMGLVLRAWMVANTANDTPLTAPVPGVGVGGGVVVPKSATTQLP